MPQSVNELLHDLSVGHAVGVYRLSSATAAKLVALVDRTHDAVVRRLAAGGQTALGEQRLNALLAALREIVQTGYGTLTQQLSADVADLAEYEAEYQRTKITGAIPIAVEWVDPAPAQLVAATLARPFQGRLLSEWGSGLSDAAYGRVRDAVRIGFVEGQTVAQVARAISGTKTARYKDGAAEVSRRGAVGLARTALCHTANYARDYTYAQNSDLVKGVRWVSTLDMRTTPVCRARDGTVYQLGRGPRPPAHWSCLPAGACISTRSRIVGASKRWFDGKVCIIRTARSNELICTPNHPILTDNGWLAIQHLYTGSKIVCDTSAQRPSSVVKNLYDDVPARIEDVVNAFLKAREMFAMPMPTATEDFHGDGIDGKIATVWADRFLANTCDASIDEHLYETGLIGRTLDTDLPTSSGDVGILDDVCTFAGSHVSPAYLHGLAIASQRDASFAQDALQRARRDAEFYTDIIRCPTSEIFLDDVVSVDRRDFSGHVYNLETVDGTFTAETIVTHNCRSTTAPVLKSWREMGVPIDEVPEGTRASMDGQVPESTTYQTWLQRQPASVQDEVLGATRGALFRRGGLTLDRFVDMSGRQYTIQELRRRDADAFAAANVGAA